WSETPKQTFEFKVRLRIWGGDLLTVTALPDGRFTFGTRAFAIGDHELDGAAEYLTDGTTIWHQAWDDHQPKLREDDPHKGAEGRLWWPAFIDGWHKDGWRIKGRGCVLVTAPSGLASSPLGLKDGLLGLKVREPIADGDYVCEVERIDGVTWR